MAAPADRIKRRPCVALAVLLALLLTTVGQVCPVSGMLPSTDLSASMHDCCGVDGPHQPAPPIDGPDCCDVADPFTPTPATMPTFETPVLDGFAGHDGVAPPRDMSAMPASLCMTPPWTLLAQACRMDC